jgi:hypothetical protein
MEYYTYATQELANTALAVINAFMPIVGLKQGEPAPTSAQTTSWMTEPTLMLSGEYAIQRISAARLDNCGELTEVDGAWTYAGVPMQDRIDFITDHGSDIRTLTSVDFPSSE